MYISVRYEDRKRFGWQSSIGHGHHDRDQKA